jgi:hypothetical protein
MRKTKTYKIEFEEKKLFSDKQRSKKEGFIFNLMLSAQIFNICHCKDSQTKYI